MAGGSSPAVAHGGVLWWRWRWRCGCRLWSYLAGGSSFFLCVFLLHFFFSGFVFLLLLLPLYASVSFSLISLSLSVFFPFVVLSLFLSFVLCFVCPPSVIFLCPFLYFFVSSLVPCSSYLFSVLFSLVSKTISP